MTTQQTEQGSSDQVGSTQATSTGSTGTSGGSAGNSNSSSSAAAGAIPTSVAVVAPKGFRRELQQMLQGWQAAMPGTPALASSVGMLTQASVLGQLQEYLGTYAAMDTHATGLRQMRLQARDELADSEKYYAALRSALRSFFGDESPQLAQFGLKPKKTPTPLTSEERAVRVAKARATRALRGTKGSVQLQGIKSGPLQFMAPVAVTSAASEPSGAPVASPALVDPTASAASPPPTK